MLQECLRSNPRISIRNAYSSPAPTRTALRRSAFWQLNATPCYARHMADDAKPEPVPFTVDVTVDRTRVQVTLLLRPGTAVTVAETKTTTVEKREPTS